MTDAQDDIIDITEESLTEALGHEPHMLAPALAVGARVSREPHLGFPDVENITYLELIVQAPLGPNAEIIVAILPLIMDNSLADDLGLTPEIVLTRDDLDTESDSE